MMMSRRRPSLPLVVLAALALGAAAGCATPAARSETPEQPGVLRPVNGHEAHRPLRFPPLHRFVDVIGAIGGWSAAPGDAEPDRRPVAAFEPEPEAKAERPPPPPSPVPMFCGDCGSALAAWYRYCGRCGAPSRRP